MSRRTFEEVHVGERICLGTAQADREEMISLAERFDPQPYHIDEERAAETIFGGIIASGLYTLGLVNKLVVEEYLNDLATMGGQGIDEIRYDEPVRPKDALTIYLEVSRKEPSGSRPERGYVDFDIEARNQRGNRVFSAVFLGIVERTTD